MRVVRDHAEMLQEAGQEEEVGLQIDFHALDMAAGRILELADAPGAAGHGVAEQRGVGDEGQHLLVHLGLEHGR